MTAPRRAPAARSRAPIAPALALAIALHLLVLLALDTWWRRAGEPEPRPAAITVVLAPRAAAHAADPVVTDVPRSPRPAEPMPAATEAVGEAPPAAPGPTDEAPAPATSPRPAAAPAQQAPPAPPAAVAEAPPPVPPAAAAAPGPSAEPIVLFAPDGRLRVPTAVLQGEPPPVPSWIAAPHASAPWEERADPLVYEATVFEPIWKPDRESVLDEFVRLNTRTRTFRTPWGSKVTCSWVLIVGGCAW